MTNLNQCSLRVAVLAMLAAAAVALASCGTPLVKGWRGEHEDEATPAERCEAETGFSWVGGECRKDADLNLTDIDSRESCERVGDAGWYGDRCIAYRDLSEDQCRLTQGWTWAAGQCRSDAEAQCIEGGASAWVDGQCLARPTLRVGGDTVQSVARGQPIKPLDLVLSPGSTAQLENSTCDGYFKLVNNTLGSTDGMSLAETQGSCEVDVVAAALTTRSVAVHVTITLVKGFSYYCKSVDAPQAVRTTVFALVEALKKPDCDEAAKALADATQIDLTEAGISDLSPLAGLPKLQWLGLAKNFVVDLAPLRDLQSLKLLDLRDNDVESAAPLAGLRGLQFLQLGRNPLGSSVARTEENCPTGDGVNAALRAFCKAGR